MPPAASLRRRGRSSRMKRVAIVSSRCATPSAMKKAGVDGRSRMTKAELADALARKQG